MKKSKKVHKLLQDLYLKEPTNEQKLFELTNALIKNSEQLEKLKSEKENLHVKQNNDLHKLNNVIIDSNNILFENIKNKKKLINSYTKDLNKTNIKYQLYYPAIESIYFDGDYTADEKNFVMELGFDKRMGSWYYAFCILAYRYRNNDHFIGLFQEKGIEPLNYKSLSSLEYYAEKFNNQRNKQQNKRCKNKNKK